MDKRKKILIVGIISFLAIIALIIGIWAVHSKNNKADKTTASSQENSQDSPEGSADKDTAQVSVPGVEQLEQVTLVQQQEQVYATTKVNVRTAPSKDASVFQVAQVKQEYTREAYDSTWSLVVIDGTSYFIASEYLTTDLAALEEKIAQEQAAAEAAAAARAQSLSGSAGTGICYNMSAAHIVAIDAGHQSRGNSEKEPNGPGSSTMKAKVTGGTTGTTTGLTEYQLNLNVAMKLKDELLSRGYGVVMIRETNDVNISNVERAQIAQNAGADILVRIHANGADNASANGIMTICMTSGNPYNGDLYTMSRSLSDKVLDGAANATGAKRQSVWETDTMTGINWAAMPVTIIEMGYMTNPTEDANLARDDYQQKMASGIANGIDRYYQ